MNRAVFARSLFAKLRFACELHRERVSSSPRRHAGSKAGAPRRHRLERLRVRRRVPFVFDIVRPLAVAHEAVLVDRVERRLAGERARPPRARRRRRARPRAVTDRAPPVREVERESPRALRPHERGLATHASARRRRMSTRAASWRQGDRGAVARVVPTRAPPSTSHAPTGLGVETSSSLRKASRIAAKSEASPRIARFVSPPGQRRVVPFLSPLYQAVQRLPAPCKALCAA